MITRVIDLLQNKPHYNVSIEVEIAKGSNSIPLTFRGLYEQIKRKIKFKNGTRY
jgi:hypothetical protein